MFRLLWMPHNSVVGVVGVLGVPGTAPPLGGVSSMLLISQKPAGKMEGDVE